MKILRTIWSRIRSLWQRPAVKREIDEELRFHVEMRTAENIAAGMSSEEAAREARKRFGNVQSIREECREVRGASFGEAMLQDLRFGLRMLRKNPGFTTTAVLTLALGIGINTAVFILFDGFVLRPPQIKDPERVVSVCTKDGRGGHSSYPEYIYYRNFNTVFMGVAAYTGTSVTLGGISKSGAPQADDLAHAPVAEEQLSALLVSGNYFHLLGGRTALGRTFLPDEDQVPEAHPVVILSHSFWQRHFGSDSTLIGSTLTLNGHPFTVIGIASPDFTGTLTYVPDAWIPMMMQADALPELDLLHSRISRLDVIGRLKPGVSVAQAQAEMSVLARQIALPDSESDNAGVELTSISTLPVDVIGKTASIVALVMTVVGMVLLIVAANVANLSLARAATRHREIGVRLALGASRGRLVRQLLTESILLAGLGGALGLLLACAATRLLLVVINAQSSLAIGVSPNLRILGYVVGISLATGMITGLAPALQSTRLDLVTTLKDEGTVFGRCLSRSSLRNLLVIVQVATCVMLLVCAGMLVRSLEKAQTIDPGFDMKRVLVVTADLPSHGYDPVRSDEFYRNFTERLHQLTGVKAVGLASTVPLAGKGIWTMGNVFAQDRPEPEKGHRLAVDFSHVSPDFFATLGIPVLQGRTFNEDETRHNRQVAVINETLARQLWPGENPIGKQFSGIDKGTEVVGVVRNTRSSQLWEPNKPYFYLPYRPLLQDKVNAATFLVRTEGDPRQTVAEIRGAVNSLDERLWPAISGLEGNLDRWLEPYRIGAWLSTVLGLLTLLIASIGLYGVIAYATNQRTREIGIRMALGARPTDVVRLVPSEGLRLVFVGMVIGIGGAVGFGRVLSRFLYGLSPIDPIAFGTVSVLLTAVAILACYLPARRAAKVDPMTALRCE